MDSYYSYLLRFWQDTEEGRMVWRFSLEDSQSQVRRGFPNLEVLYSFLRNIIEAESSQNDYSCFP
jgi:hypothetical protein